ncbi:YraN family protein [Actinoalloteichus caeruleus]|uniref:YraN family protein n=1 Tax=Actinoalloteichus cyanogriseus TaxID=2893586 RepID=UPI0009DD9BC0|nr:YraN family protein [Actinoalloteichus caeruleus]
MTKAGDGTCGGVEVATRVVPTRELGRWGEDVAVAHLERQGLVVLSRNWRCRHGELDVVAVDDDTLVVCEVKTRFGPSAEDPASAVTPAKLKRLRTLTAAWLSRYHVGWCAVRFDVVSVVLPTRGPATLRHFQGVS